MNQPPKVFICYAREDMAHGKRIYHDLQKYDVTPWLDLENLQPGQEWKDMTSKAIKQSDHVLVLLSSHSLNKEGYFRKDLNDALKMLDIVPPDTRFLIPVRLEKCEPQEVTLQHLQWCDLFESYEKGFNRILKVICPDGIRIHLRSEPLMVSEEEFREVFQLTDHDIPRKNIRNDFEDQGDVIVDKATGLMWQTSGSDDAMKYEETQVYVDVLNTSRFAGYNNWRLPTIPELMSLLELEKQSNDLFMKPIFGGSQRWCWSADKRSSSRAAWYVGFNDGDVDWGYLGINYGYVRCVRSLTK